MLPQPINASSGIGKTQRGQQTEMMATVLNAGLISRQLMRVSGFSQGLSTFRLEVFCASGANAYQLGTPQTEGLIT